MKLSDLGEFGLIEKIRRATPQGTGVRLGIGDDAAWVECRKPTLLFTTDGLLEKIHFNLQWTSLKNLGWKSLAVNLSDIAAMGGEPAYFLLSLGIPVDFKVEDIDKFCLGLAEAASEYGVSLVGGNTTASERLMIHISVMGYAPHGAIKRSGGKIGDDLYATGTLGDSALGLKILKRKRKRMREIERFLASRHERPSPRVDIGKRLAKEGLATAMIDVSDGLIQDLTHLCRSSHVGAEIWSDAIPLSKAYRSFVGKRDPIYALNGGEDYELVFSVPQKRARRLDRLKRLFKTPVSRIGKFVEAKKGIRIINSKGETVTVPLSGYDHFKL